jgi:hypothetical protein
MEEGRRRYRVRLGFFTNEADAETVLKSVRGKFASAFTSCLCDEDVKHASGYLKKPVHEIQEIQDIQRTGRYKLPKFSAADLPPELSGVTGRHAIPKAPPPAAANSQSIARAASALLDTHQPTVKQTNVQQTNRPTRAAREEVVEFEVTPEVVGSAQQKSNTKVPPTANKAAQFVQRHQQSASAAEESFSQPVFAHASPKDIISRDSARPVPPIKHTTKPASQPARLEIAAPPPPTASPRHAVQNGQPFHVGAGRTIADHGLSIAHEKNAPPKPATPAMAKPDLPRPLVSAEALAKLRAAAQPRQQSSEIPTLDTTQTIRTLTKTEIEDANAPKWFVVQLAISDHPANLDTMPRLDIFEAYRLYSVAVMEANVIRHALRLGFFSEKVSAEAVLGYLKTFFGDPVIERISDAEQKRFADALPPKTGGSIEAAKSNARVITLEEKRPLKPIDIAPTPASNKPVRTTPPATQNKSASKSAASSVKRSAPMAAKKTSGRVANGKSVSRKEISEARMLGLSETAIRRVEHNPSLLSRLVGKLTK